jgi:hypothetical protein
MLGFGAKLTIMIYQDVSEGLLFLRETATLGGLQQIFRQAV